MPGPKRAADEAPEMSSEREDALRTKAFNRALDRAASDYQDSVNQLSENAQESFRNWLEAGGIKRPKAEVDAIRRNFMDRVSVKQDEYIKQKAQEKYFAEELKKIQAEEKVYQEKLKQAERESHEKILKGEPPPFPEDYRAPQFRDLRRGPGGEILSDPEATVHGRRGGTEEWDQTPRASVEDPSEADSIDVRKIDRAPGEQWDTTPLPKEVPYERRMAPMPAVEEHPHAPGPLWVQYKRMRDPYAQYAEERGLT